MIPFVFALIFGLIGLCVIVFSPKGTPLKAVGLGLVGVGFVFLLWSMVFRLDTSEAAVLKPVSGKVTQASGVTEPGLHFKAPWDKVIRFDIKNQTIDLYGNCERNGQDDLLDGAEDCEIKTSTNDSADVFISSTTNYNIDPTKVVDVYIRYRSQDNLVSRDLLPGIRSAQRDAPTTYPAASIRQSRPALTASILGDLEERLKGTGVQIVRVDLRTVNLDEESTNRLRAVQLANADIEKERQAVTKAQLEAERIKTIAKANSDADQIQRCGAVITDGTQVINGKDTPIKVITPVSNDDCQNRLNEQVIASKYIDALVKIGEKGNLVVVPQGTNPIVNIGK